MNKDHIIEQRNKILKNTNKVVIIEYTSNFYNYGYVEAYINICELTRPKLTRNTNIPNDKKTCSTNNYMNSLLGLISSIQK
jgi:hypothetical protein